METSWLLHSNLAQHVFVFISPTIVLYHFYLSLLQIKTLFIYIYISTSWFAELLNRVLNSGVDGDEVMLKNVNEENIQLVIIWCL